MTEKTVALSLLAIVAIIGSVGLVLMMSQQTTGNLAKSQRLGAGGVGPSGLIYRTPEEACRAFDCQDAIPMPTGRIDTFHQTVECTCATYPQARGWMTLVLTYG